MYYVSWYLQKLCRFLSKFLCHIETFFGYVFLKLPCEWRHSNTWSPSTSLPRWGQRVQQCLIFDVFKELHLRLLKKNCFRSIHSLSPLVFAKHLHGKCLKKIWMEIFLGTHFVWAVRLDVALSLKIRAWYSKHLQGRIQRGFATPPVNRFRIPNYYPKLMKS